MHAEVILAMAGPKKNFSVEFTPENYGFLSTLAHAENPSWPSSVDRLINRIVDEMRAKKNGGAMSSAPR
jgi:hypothetical protein